jgi:hypothetical protein
MLQIGAQTKHAPMQIQFVGQLALVEQVMGAPSPPGTSTHAEPPPTTGTQKQLVFVPNEQLNGGWTPGQTVVKLGVQAPPEGGAADRRATDPTIMGAT